MSERLHMLKPGEAPGLPDFGFTRAPEPPPGYKWTIDAFDPRIEDGRYVVDYVFRPVPMIGTDEGSEGEG